MTEKRRSLECLKEDIIELGELTRCGALDALLEERVSERGLKQLLAEGGDPAVPHISCSQIYPSIF